MSAMSSATRLPTSKDAEGRPRSRRHLESSSAYPAAKRRRANGDSKSRGDRNRPSRSPSSYNSSEFFPSPRSIGPPPKPAGPRCTLRPGQSRKIQAVVITITRNNQGVDSNYAYCLAALAGNLDGSGRLIRLVPDTAHFWDHDKLPVDIRNIHDRFKDSLPDEPHWPFTPFQVAFEAGTVPDSVTGPHKLDDVVARKLEWAGELEEPYRLYEQLSYIAADRLHKVWPDSVWASHKSLRPETEVASLALFNGQVESVSERGDKLSPYVSLIIGGKHLSVPYAAHRLHDDKGLGMLRWLAERPTCTILLGLSRTYTPKGSHEPQCPILCLRIFPCT